ncbi:MAG: hypothetical protein GX542_00285 [Rhodococcus sp.]|nr:hypothetical protein [Rhodococcus sp. (in: high G+C Gram-positive bacteria)]
MITKTALMTLAAFAAVLAVLFIVGYLLGAAFGPESVEPDTHDHGLRSPVSALVVAEEV